MQPIDIIRDWAQDTYYTVNGVVNDDEGEDLTAFENDFIRGFNLWKDEYETEAYWNNLRVTDYNLGTISNTTTYSFELPDDYRTPVINQNKYLKFVNDGTVIAKFKMVDPSQRIDDGDYNHPDRAAFVGRNIILSRPPRDTEVGSSIVLDVVEYIPNLTRTDATALELVYSKQLAVLGVAKNGSLANVVKTSLSPSFAQKYNNELQKSVAINNASNDIDEMQRDSYNYIGGIW